MAPCGSLRGGNHRGQGRRKRRNRRCTVACPKRKAVGAVAVVAIVGVHDVDIQHAVVDVVVDVVVVVLGLRTVVELEEVNNADADNVV